MLEIIAIIFGVLLVLILALLGYAATKPDTFRVQRATTIKAPPEKIFALINDFHHWSRWSPWEKLDPAMKKTYSGTAAGKGAIYEWEGNKKAGQGRMEIMESTPSSKVLIKLDFLRPMRASNVTEITTASQADGMHVNWVMTGQSPFMFKVMTIFMNMDKLIGKDFEEGLSNLKALTEK